MMKRTIYSIISKSNGRGSIFSLCLCVSVFQLFVLASCVKDDLYDTPHPAQGGITVTADWSGCGEGVGVPASWRVAIGDYTGTETGATHTPDRLFEPGSYRLTAYNDAENITVSGTMATAAAASGNWDGVGGFITDTPGWLFTSTQEVTVEKDCDHAFTAEMRQQVRELILTVEPKGDAAGRIESIEGYISGAAGTLDFATGVHGTPSNVELRFTKITEGSDAGKWSATVRLLGVTGSTQRLTATIAYAGGNPRPTGFDSDLTQALGGFNDNKTVPLTLGGTVTETPTAVGVGATVDDWTEVDGGSADAS